MCNGCGVGIDKTRRTVAEGGIGIDKTRCAVALELK